eukprot:CFRG5785T1
MDNSVPNECSSAAFGGRKLIPVVEGIRNTLKSTQLNERTWSRETKALLSLAEEFINLRTRQTQVERGLSEEAEVETAGSLYLMRHEVAIKVNLKCQQMGKIIRRMRANVDEIESARNTIAMSNTCLINLPIPLLRHSSIQNICEWWREVYGAYCREYTLVVTAAEDIINHTHDRAHDVVHLQLTSILSHPYLSSPKLRQTRELLHATIRTESDEGDDC